MWRIVCPEPHSHIESALPPADPRSVMRAGEGLDWLERACETRSGLLVYLKVEPMFDSLRAEPRFVSLMRRLAFP